MFDGAVMLDETIDQGKRPWALTSAEVAGLMEAFTQGKGMVLEEDCVTLCAWAQHLKRGALALAGVLEGVLTPRSLAPRCA